MDIEQYKNFLLSRIPGAHVVSGGKEIQCRCFNPSCEDCYDYRSKGHLYISIPDNTKPSVYNCFKCGYSGVVTHNTLLEWNIFDQSIGEEIYKYNSSIKTNKVNDKYFNRITYRVFNTITRDDQVSKIKLDYINNRLGTNLTFDEVRRLKIILNLYDTINENGIKKLTRDQNIVNQLDQNFLGFLSIDNAFVNMRRLCDKGLVYKSIDKRYINYKLFDKFDSSERFYVIPSIIENIYAPKRIKINIAEGPFDILSIYLNLRNREEGIYIAGTGCNYFSIALYCLEVFGIINAEIHFYQDTDDVANKKIQFTLNNIRNLGLPVYIHKNMMEGEKDFGVRLSQIKESIIQIY